MSSPEEYSHVVLKQAIARASLALGYKNAEPDVLEALSDVMQECIEKISRECAANAQLHGRAQPGIQDALEALESLRPLKSGWKDLRDFAFPDLIDTDGNATAASASATATATATTAEGMDASSTAAKGEEEETKDGAATSSNSTTTAPSSSSRAWRQPFPYGVPPFPVRAAVKSSSSSSSSAALEERPVRGAQVPLHLPPYPPQHTYPHRSNAATLHQKSGGSRSSRKRQVRVYICMRIFTL